MKTKTSAVTPSSIRTGSARQIGGFDEVRSRITTETVTVRLVLASASQARRITLERAGITPTVHVSQVDEEAITRAAHHATPVPDLALMLARAKCLDVAATLRHAGPPVMASARAPGGHSRRAAPTGADARSDSPHSVDHQRVLVLGCDSMLEFEGQGLGKPATAEQAVSRWKRMRGRSGVLHTGHWLVDLSAAQGAADPATAAGSGEGAPGGAGGAGALASNTAGRGAVAATSVTFTDLDDEEIVSYVRTGEPLGVAGGFTIDGLGAAFVQRIEGDHHNVVGLSVPLLRCMVRELGIAWPELWAPRSPG